MHVQKIVIYRIRTACSLFCTYSDWRKVLRVQSCNSRRRCCCCNAVARKNLDKA